MQEDQTVSFSPMYVDGPEPWFTQLFVLYTLIVLVVFSVRVIKLLAGLPKLRKMWKSSTPSAMADSLWAECYARANSLEKISALTFFVSLLNTTWLTANVFLSARTEKEVSSSYVLARAGDGLVYLALGLIVCIVLYSTAMLGQAALRRWNPRALAEKQNGDAPGTVARS